MTWSYLVGPLCAGPSSQTEAAPAVHHTLRELGPADPDGVDDMRPLPIEQRKAKLARLGEHADGWIALTDGVVGEGRALFRAVVDGLEGMVAKHLADAYHPKFARWFSTRATRSVAAAPNGSSVVPMTGR
jgi:hypothetical protein